MPTYKPRKNAVSILDKIPDNARQLILSSPELKLVKNYKSKAKDNQYKKSVYLLYYDGYDFLENLHVVRVYVQKRYEISFNILELLLHLFPKQFFTSTDYYRIQKQFTLNNVHYLMQLGFVMNVSTLKTKPLYTLTRTATSIVTLFYELLSGEKQIPLNVYSKNKMIGSEATNSDKKRMAMIKRLQAEPVPETKKIFWTKSDPDDKS